MMTPTSGACVRVLRFFMPHPVPPGRTGRAEGAALGAAVLASAVLAQGWRVRAIGQQMRAMSGGLAVGLLLVALWHGYFYAEFGAILPSTLAAKLAHGHKGWPTFAAALPGVFRASLCSPWLAAPGALAIVFHAPGLVAWAVIHCTLLALSGIPQKFYPDPWAETLIGVELQIGRAHV